MKNYINAFAAVMLLGMCLDANVSAQDRIARYSGEVTLGYSYGIDEGCSYARLEVLNGALITDYFFAGVGIGAERCLADEPLFFPVYLNLKGLLPVGEKVSLFLGADFGTRIDYSYGTSGGFLFRPEFGARFGLGRRFGLDVALKYDYYAATEDYVLWGTVISGKIRNNGIGLRVGFVF